MVNKEAYRKLKNRLNDEIRAENIMRIVSRMSSIDIKERTRLRRVTELRQITFYLLHRKTRMSYQKIGNFFGLTHATVLHGVKLVKVLIETDRNFNQKYGLIINTINHIYCDK